MRRKRIFNKDGGPLPGAVFRRVETALDRAERLGVLPDTGSKVFELDDAVVSVRTSSGFINASVVVPKVTAEPKGHTTPYESFAFVTGGTAYGDYRSELEAANALVKTVFSVVFGESPPSSYDYTSPTIATSASKEQLSGIEVIPAVELGSACGEPTYDPVITRWDTGGYLQFFAKQRDDGSYLYLMRGIPVGPLPFSSVPDSILVQERAGTWFIVGFPFTAHKAYAVYWPDRLSPIGLLENPTYLLGKYLPVYATIEYDPPEAGSPLCIYDLAGKRCTAAGEVYSKQHGLTRDKWEAAALQPSMLYGGVQTYDLGAYDITLAESQALVEVGRLGNYLVTSSDIIVGYNDELGTAVAYATAERSTIWSMVVEGDFLARFEGFDDSLAVLAGATAATYRVYYSFIDNVTIRTAIEGYGFEFRDFMSETVEVHSQVYTDVAENLGLYVAGWPYAAVGLLNHNIITPYIVPTIRANVRWVYNRTCSPGRKVAFDVSDGVRLVYSSSDIHLPDASMEFSFDISLGAGSVETLYPVEEYIDPNTGAVHSDAYTPYAIIRGDQPAVEIAPFIASYLDGVYPSTISTMRREFAHAPLAYDLGSTRELAAAHADTVVITTAPFGNEVSVTTIEREPSVAWSVPVTRTYNVEADWEAVPVKELEALLLGAYDFSGLPQGSVPITEPNFSGLKFFGYMYESGYNGFWHPDTTYIRKLRLEIQTESPQLTVCAYSDALPPADNLYAVRFSSVRGAVPIRAVAPIYAIAKQQYISANVIEAVRNGTTRAAMSMYVDVGYGPGTYTWIGTGGPTFPDGGASTAVALYDNISAISDIDYFMEAAAGLWVDYGTGTADVILQPLHQLLLGESIDLSSAPYYTYSPKLIREVMDSAVTGVSLLDATSAEQADTFIPDARVTISGDLSHVFTMMDFKQNGIPDIEYLPATSAFYSAVNPNPGVVVSPQDWPYGCATSPGRMIDYYKGASDRVLSMQLIEAAYEEMLDRLLYPIAVVGASAVPATQYSSAVQQLEAQLLEDQGYSPIPLRELVSVRTSDTCMFKAPIGASAFKPTVSYTKYAASPACGNALTGFTAVDIPEYVVPVPPGITWGNANREPLPAIKCVGGAFPPMMNVWNFL